MSRKTLQRARRQKAQRQRKAARKERRRRSRLGAWLITPTGIFWQTVSLVLAILGFYYVAKAKVIIEPDPTGRAHTVMQTPFLVTNNSLFSIYGVERGYRVLKISSTAAHNWVEGGTFINKLPPIRELRSGEAASLTIPFPFETTPGKDFDAGDIEVFVTYKTAIFKLHREQANAFELRRDADGARKWYRKALSEHDPKRW